MRPQDAIRLEAGCHCTVKRAEGKITGLAHHELQPGAPSLVRSQAAIRLLAGCLDLGGFGPMVMRLTLLMRSCNQQHRRRRDRALRFASVRREQREWIVPDMMRLTLLGKVELPRGARRLARSRLQLAHQRDATALRIKPKAERLTLRELP